MWFSEYKEKFGITTYKELVEMQYSYLDQIDFKPYLDRYDDLDDIWNAVEDDYDDSEITHNDFLQGCIFNQLDHFELKLYLEKRYNTKICEETITKYYIVK